MFKQKKVNALMIVLLVVVMLAGVVGCSKGTGGAAEKKGGKGGASSSSISLPEKLDNPDVVFLNNIDPYENPTQVAALKAFEEKYGGKFTYIPEVNAQMQTKLIAMISAGDSPDFIGGSLDSAQQYAALGLIQPVDQYFDLDDPIHKMNIMKPYRYKGKDYGVTRDTVAWVIFYNKTLFENNGVKTPLEYYKEGQWNWGNFRKAGMALTQDTNGDGVIDQWGYIQQTGNPWQFIDSNGGKVISFRDDGGIDLTIKDSRVIEAIQFAWDGYNKDKYFNPKHNNVQADFASGTVAMVTERTPGYLGKTKDSKYEIDFAPFPVGPSGDPKVQPGGGGFHAIPVGAKNPKGAAAVIYLFNKYAREMEIDKLMETHTQEQAERSQMLRENLTGPDFGSIGLTKTVQDNLWIPLRGGKGGVVSTLVESSAPILQAAIDDYIKNINDKK